MRKYEAQVSRGINFLNKKKRGWRKKINLETLNMNHAHLCILGQVFGTYFLPVEIFFNGDGDESEKYGFTVMGGVYAKFSALNKEWKRQLNNLHS